MAGEVHPGLDVHAAIVGLVPGDEDGQRDEHEEDVRHEAEPVQEALVGQRPVVGDAGSILLLAAKSHRHGEYLEGKKITGILHKIVHFIQNCKMRSLR